MTSDIEKALKNFMIAVLSGDDHDFGTEDSANILKAFSLEALPDLFIPVTTAKSNDRLPGALPCVVITCNDSTHDVGTLYMARVTLSISTPMRVENVTEDMHRDIVKSIRGLWIGDNAAALDSALQEAGSLSQRGWFEIGPNESIQGERWQCDLSYTLGIEEITV